MTWLGGPCTLVLLAQQVAEVLPEAVTSASSLDLRVGRTDRTGTATSPSGTDTSDGLGTLGAASPERVEAVQSLDVGVLIAQLVGAVQAQARRLFSLFSFSQFLNWGLVFPYCTFLRRETCWMPLSRGFDAAMVMRRVTAAHLVLPLLRVPPQAAQMTRPCMPHPPAPVAHLNPSASCRGLTSSLTPDLCEICL